MDLSNLDRALPRGAVDMGMNPQVAKRARSSHACEAANNASEGRSS
jgi:hypothetical protein